MALTPVKDNRSDSWRPWVHSFMSQTLETAAQQAILLCCIPSLYLIDCPLSMAKMALSCAYKTESQTFQRNAQ